MSMIRVVTASLLFAACKVPISADVRNLDAGASSALDASDSSVADAADASTVCGPTRVTLMGKRSIGNPYWDGDVLVDGHNAFDPETFSPRAVPATPAAPKERWRVVPGGDNSIAAIVDTNTSKNVPITASDARLDLGLAVDENGRLYDLASGSFRSSAFSCGGSQGAGFGISSKARFVICDAHGEGIVLLDVAAKWQAPLGDGRLQLARGEGYGVMIPGPFDGYWGHVKTKRTTIDKVVWDSAGHVTTTTVGARGAEVTVGDEVYALVTGRHVTVRRACDDAVIYDQAAARPPGEFYGSAASLSGSGKYLMLSGGSDTAVLRID